MATLPQPGDDFTGANTFTQNFTTQTALPGGSYVVALSFKTVYDLPTSLTGVKFKLSNTGQTSGYISSPSNTLPCFLYCYQNHFLFHIEAFFSTGCNWVGFQMEMYQTQSYQVCGIFETFSNLFFSLSNISNPGNSNSRTMIFQVLATPNRQW